jgi:hypothetical protein
MVAGCLLVYIYEIFTALWFLDWLDFLIAALFAYPHIFFIIEVHEGILSESTYDVEEFSDWWAMRHSQHRSRTNRQYHA